MGRVWCLLVKTGLLLLLTSSSFALTSDLEEPVHTHTWAVHLHPGCTDEDADVVAKEFGFVKIDRIFPDDCIYEFNHPHVRKRSIDSSSHHTLLLESHAKVKSAVQQIAKRRVKRGHSAESFIKLSDPKWSQTWYLNRGINSQKYDMNVIPAWQSGYTGTNIVVTILDDGIEKDHPDLIANYDPQASTDINGNDRDPQPRYDYTNENRHGTRCAGEVAASANNSVCSVGVAYHAKIGGIRMLDGDVTDVVESKSLSFNKDHIDIYSASWGPDDNGRTVDGPGTLAKKSFINGVEKGRNGKGNIFLWASGNGGSHADSCACDGYTNSIYTLSVSSASEKNTHPWYLEECASTLATTYSSGANFGEKQIVTTDLRKQCTARHTGTSASAPLAAGLVAVMLSANPSLNWRDVQYITLAAANPEPLKADGQFEKNAVNRYYSHRFGYGLMDCYKMVQIARNWTEVPLQLIKSMPKVSPQRSIGSMYGGEVVVPHCASGDTGCIRYLEHVQLSLDMTSTKRGQLTVDVISPLGTRSTVLPKRRSDTISAGFKDWPFLSVHFWGENPAGKWKFEIRNGNVQGQIKSYQLIIYGVSVDPFDSSQRHSVIVNCDEACDEPAGCFGSGPDQCRKCAADLYREEDTNKCVAQCHDGYYADKSSLACRLCDFTCQTCDGKGGSSCVTCSEGLLLDAENHCVEECRVGYYPDKERQACTACKTECTSCTSADDCLQCADGFDVFNGQCKIYCTDREHRNKISGECKPCLDENCSVCSDDGLCVHCDVDFYLYKGQCVSECPANAYLQRLREDSTHCLDCSERCVTCYEGLDNNCLSCEAGYSLTATNKCVLNKTCEAGFYKSSALGECQRCNETCYTCHGPDPFDCTSCANSSLRDGACVQECGTGLYKYEAADKHTSCQRCHHSCLNCSGPNDNDCLNCSSYHRLEDGRCLSSCNTGQYMKEDGEFGSGSNDVGCENCHPNCLSCSKGPSESDCTSCSPSLILDEGLGRGCVSFCEPGYFVQTLPESSRACNLCDGECLTCSGGSYDDCLSCEADKFLLNNRCVDRAKCYSNQYYNSTNNECFACHPSCLSCNGASENDCLSCNASGHLKLYERISRCVVCCADGNIRPSYCCDCHTNADEPICDEATEATEDDTVKKASETSSHVKTFIVAAILGILGLVMVCVIIFLYLQYKSDGRCVIRLNRSNTLLVDGAGVVE